jgi:WD repeat-containing protein 45
MEEEKCVVGWIQAPNDHGDSSQMEHQLIALTYTGCWYRLGLPTKAGSTTGIPSSVGRPLSGPPPSGKSMRHYPRSSSVSSVGRTIKGKEKESSDKEGKESRECTLLEYRKFGRWDGWG